MPIRKKTIFIRIEDLGKGIELKREEVDMKTFFKDLGFKNEPEFTKNLTIIRPYLVVNVKERSFIIFEIEENGKSEIKTVFLERSDPDFIIH